MQGGLAGAGGIRRRLLVWARQAWVKLHALVSEPQHHHQEEQQLC